MRPKVKKMILIAPFAIAGITLFIFLGGWIVMSLWNYLLPALFGWRIITFWQALGLLILCRILFGGFGGHGKHRSGSRMGGPWSNMTPEEREKFREGMRAKWGFGPSAGETPKV